MLAGYNYNNLSNTESFNDGQGFSATGGVVNCNSLYVNGLSITHNGQNGQGFNFRGIYSGSSSYLPYDVVTYNGSCYCCILASTNNLPTNTTYWSIFSQKGDTRASGQGFNFQGVYSATTSYSPYDLLTWNSSTYMCLISSTGNQPDDNTHFICFARGLCWKGEYVGTPTTYDVNDICNYSDGNTYICIAQTPYPGGYHCSNTTYWALFVQQGQQGPQGDTGATGDSGLDAFFTILGLSGSIASSLTTIATVNSSLSAMQSELDGFAGTLTTLQGEVDTLDTQVSTLQNKTQYQTATNTTPTTNFSSDIVVTDSTGITTKVHLAQDGSITATGAISGTSICGTSLYSLGNSGINTDTSYLDSSVVNVGTRNNATVSIGSGTSFSTINITGLNINLTGIVTINGIPFVNGFNFSSGINQFA
jgi:hypothetical protein